MIDPYSALLAKCWEAVQTDPELSLLVKPGNMVKYTTETRIPEKTTVQDADMPQLEIVPVSDTPNICATSNTGIYMHRMEWRLTTIDLRVNQPKGLFPVMWAIFRVLARARDTWQQCYLISARPTAVNYQQNIEGTKGWTAIITVEFQLQINRQALINGGF